MLKRFHRPFLNGNFRNGNRQPLKRLLNPSTEEPLEPAIEQATVKDVDEAVSLARQALEGVYGNMTGAERRDRLWCFAKGLADAAEEIAHLESLSGGKPIAEARDDVQSSVEVFRYFAGFADKLHGKTGKISSTLTTSSWRKPIGVCGVITSYNYPLVLASWKIAPALACGNAVIIKPHPLTPLSMLYLGHLFQAFPAGSVAILPGETDVGRAMTEHPGIDKISFTGSGSVGRHVMMASAQSNFKRVTLELGGKSAAIVFEDANLNQAVDDVFGAIFSNMGQNCCAGSRLFLHSSIHDSFLERLQDRIRLVRIGDALDERYNYGPVIDRVQFDKIMDDIHKARDRGCKVLCGGNRFGQKGYFIEPTVFWDIDDKDDLASHEIFGPVLSVMKPFDTEEEVIGRANATPFGLASGLWTTDVGRVHRIVPQLKAGTTWVNCYNWIHPSMPFGGVKESGFGYDLGEEAILQEYTYAHSVYISH